MKNEISQLLERQAAWQRKQADLPWGEKLRQAEILRDAGIALRNASGQSRYAVIPKKHHL